MTVSRFSLFRPFGSCVDTDERRPTDEPRVNTAAVLHRRPVHVRIEDTKIPCVANSAKRPTTKNEHRVRDALIDLIPFKRAVPRTSPAYQAPAAWSAAACDITDNYIRETSQGIDLVALAEAISCIELAREIRNGAGPGASPLRRVFPEIQTEKQASAAAIDAFLRALNQHNPNGEIQESWGRAGMGYQHRKDHLAMSGIISVLSVAQALCPEPTTKVFLASARCCMGAASLYNGWKVGAERVYYKLTDELVSLGLPDGTPSMKNAPYAPAAAWRLPSHSKLKESKQQMEDAIAALERLTPEDSAGTVRSAYQALKTVRDKVEKQRKTINEYKATSYASQIEWAAYRQRITTLGGSTALLTGAAVGIGLAAGPMGAGAGLALGVGLSIPLWAASHLTYHFKGWKAPDNRDKIERALLAAIKSPDLYDNTKTSSTDIASRYVQYRQNCNAGAVRGKTGPSLERTFRQSLVPLLNTSSVEHAWRRPVGIRVKLGKRILAGKLAIAVSKVRELEEKIQADPGNPHASQRSAQLAAGKKRLKCLWSDLANVELFMQSTAPMNGASQPSADAKKTAAAALRHVRDGHFRDLMRGDLETQMAVGEKAKRLTKGELLKYQMTYFVGSMMGDLTSIGLTVPGLAQAYEQSTMALSGAQVMHPNSTLRLGAFASVLTGVNAAEVSAGRAHFGIDKEIIYKQMARSEPRDRAKLTPEHGPHGFRWQDVPDSAIDSLIAPGTIPQTMGLFDNQVENYESSPALADLTKTAPFSQVRKSGLSWSARAKTAGSIGWVAIKYLGVSLTGLAHRMTASGLNMAPSRATRRELDQLNDHAKRLLSAKGLLGLPQLSRLDFRSLPKLENEVDRVFKHYATKPIIDFDA